MAHRFRKCETCGSHGHGGRGCPVYRLNQQQERRREQRRKNVSFGLSPELEREIILIRKAWKIAAALGLMLLCTTSLFAGTITGRLQTATGGAVTNSTLTFRLSQPAVLVGTASVVTSSASCYISAAGNIAGVPDPLVAPVLSANTISGTLPAGTYFVVVTYAGASGESVASPESTVVLSAQGTVIVNAPVKQPANATGYNVYIGTSSGAETLQASVTGFTQYSQAATLASGSVLPASNSSTCSLAFSDQLIPSGTYYAVNLVNKNGSTIAGFPQTWCTYGGQSGAINVSNGAPTGNCGTNGVIYPTPIFANPQNNALQSISGPLALPGGLVGIQSFLSGITSLYYSTLTANPAQSGDVRLADGDTACWRNHANSADVCISKNTSDQLVVPTLVSPAITGVVPGTLPATNLTLAGTLTNYNGIVTVGNGVAAEYAAVDLTTQGANVSTTTLYTTPAAGLYKVSCYTVVTRAATTSSTLPSCQVFWIDQDNSTSQGVTIAGTSTGNSLTTFGEGVAILSVKAASAIQYSTSSYATSGATSMQYAVHLRLEAM